MARHSDGSDPYRLAQYGNIGLLPTAGHGGALTVAFWVKASLSQPTSIILNHKGAFHSDQEWYLYFDTATNSVKFYSSTSSSPGTDSELVLPDSDWHHVAWRRAGSGASEWAKFLDGTKTVINASLNFSLPSGANTRISVFNHSMPNVFAFPFGGDLMDVIVERRAISDGDIAAMAAGASYNSVNPSINAGLCEIYLRMCADGDEAYIRDFSGNDRDFGIDPVGTIPGSSSPAGVGDDCDLDDETEPPPPSEERTYHYAVDWDNDGDFDDDNEIISSYVMRASWSRGRRNQEPGSVQAGECSIILDNSSGIFSSYNTSSPIYGKVLPGRLVSITMTIGDGPEVVMWVGYLDSLIPTPGAVVEVSTAELRGQGILAQFVDKKIAVAMQTNITTGDAVNLALDAAGIAAIDREVDLGQTTMARWFVKKDTFLLDVLRELEAAECGWIGEGKDGKFLFRDRAYFLGDAVQATYGDTYVPESTLVDWNLRQEDHLRGIYNRVEAEVRNFTRSDEVLLAVVSDVDNQEGGTPPVVPGSGTLVVEIEFPTEKSPESYLAVDEWTITDYQANASADGTGADLTSAVSATKVEYASKVVVTFTNGSGSDAYLVVLRQHGYALVEDTPQKVTTDDEDSQEDFKVQLYPNPSRWLTDRDEAEAYSAHILALYKDSRPRLNFEVKGNYDANHLLDVQRRDVGHRVRVVAGAPYGLGIDAEFRVVYHYHTVDEANLHVMQQICEAIVEDEWPASAYPADTLGSGDEGPPDQICARALATGRRFTLGVTAGKWNHSIDRAEFRVKLFVPTTEPTEADLRLPEEGGTDFDPDTNPTTDFVFDDLGADSNGCNMEFEIADQRTAYYAARLHNRKGWSVWSDGNRRPRHVKQHIGAEDPDTADSGPPADWEVLLKAGPTDGTVVVEATRPQTNGHRILWYVVQIKDASTGTWRLLDADTGAADTLYDGSGEAHTYNKRLGTLVRDSGAFPALTYGDLILFDVRGGAFDVQHCQWATLVSISGDTLGGLFGFRPQFAATGDEYLDVRIKVVKRPDMWNSEGYLGDEPNHGIWYREFFSEQGGERCGSSVPAGDVNTAVFQSTPLALPSGLAIEDVQARVWFENAYSRADDNARHSTGVGTTGPPDTEPPGALVDLLVTGEMGTYTATWKDPLTGNKSITTVAEQYSTDPDFDTSPPSPIGLYPYGNFLSGRSRNTAFYFRFAVQNQSGINDPSLSAPDIALLNSLGSAFMDGWGPWTYANDNVSPSSPDLIQSGPFWVIIDADDPVIDLSKGTYFILDFATGRADRAPEFINPDLIGHGFVLDMKQSADGSQTVDIEAHQDIVYTQEAEDASLEPAAGKRTKLFLTYHEDGDYYRVDGKSREV